MVAASLSPAAAEGGKPPGGGRGEEGGRGCAGDCAGASGLARCGAEDGSAQGSRAGRAAPGIAARLRARVDLLGSEVNVARKDDVVLVRVCGWVAAGLSRVRAQGKVRRQGSQFDCSGDIRWHLRTSGLQTARQALRHSRCRRSCGSSMCLRRRCARVRFGGLGAGQTDGRPPCATAKERSGGREKRAVR